jgi:hypothetical protein
MMGESQQIGIDQDFSKPLAGRWKRYTVGGGALEASGGGLRLGIPGASARRYADAQLDDYQGLARRHFPWRPPLTLTVTARFSHPAGQLRGTAGFGFWNDPFWMTGKYLPALPRAIWFFYASPDSDMQLDCRVPGHGWKAATIDAANLAAIALVPLAPLAVPLMNLAPVHRTVWPVVQRAVKVREAELEADMTAWHTYVLEWGSHAARFSLDGRPVLDDAPSPRGPLGLVVWLDNQYMVVTPRGRLGWGLLDVPGPQWLEVSRLIVKTGLPAPA